MKRIYYGGITEFILILLNVVYVCAYMGGRLSSTDISVYDMYRNSDFEYGWNLLYTKKNKLIDDSLFLKYKFAYNKHIRSKLIYNPEYVAGVFYFPHIFTMKTNLDTESVILSAFRTRQRFLYNRFLINDLVIESSIGLNFGGNPKKAFINDYTYGAFTYLQLDYGLGYLKSIYADYNLKLGFSDIFRNSAYLPVDIFRNTELETGVVSDNIDIIYAYPLVFELQKDNYPYQDKRLEIGLKKDMKNYRIKFENIYQQKKNWHSLMVNKKVQAYNLEGYVSKAQKEISGGLNISWNFDIQSYNPYMTRDNVKNELHNFAYTSGRHTLPANIADYSIEQLQGAINTPQQAEEYTYNYLSYSNDHNGFAGLSTMYDPVNVFGNKRGNCTEQARLQAYLLADNGYDLRIVGHIGYRWAHAVLFYKDFITGHWKAFDNTEGKEYYSEGDTIKELQDIVYPGWFSMVVKDKNAKGLYQIDSETRWYIQDWFNRQ